VTKDEVRDLLLQYMQIRELNAPQMVAVISRTLRLPGVEGDAGRRSLARFLDGRPVPQDTLETYTRFAESLPPD
jgi:hypothetical protein